MKKIVTLIALLSVSLAMACTGNPPPVTKTQVETAADAFCTLHEKNKALEAQYGLTPDGGTHADIEKGADAFCALRATVKKLESQPTAGSSG